MPDTVTSNQLRYEHALSDTLQHVTAEVTNQQARYGADNEVALDGTGPDVHWLANCGWNLDLKSASAIEAALRRDYESRTGAITWLDLVREEIAEAFMEDDPTRLAEELTQVAALCINWVAHIKAR